MSDLTSLEKRKLERLFNMSGGYVLNFSNRTFDEFVVESTGRSIYDEKYSHGSGSKANQLRGFCTEESNPVVARLLGNLLDLVESETLSEDVALIADCRKIVARLSASNPVAEIEAIGRIADEHDLEVVARAVLDLIEKNDLVVGLDRLHTFTTGFLRSLCEKRGLAAERGKPLHSLFGQYVRALHEAGHIQSRMTASILRALNGPLDAFNDVRNNQSLAHDNALLNHEEAILIFNHVTSSLRFLRDLERQVERREKAAASKAKQATTQDDEIPF
jgi:hypothetical protein